MTSAVYVNGRFLAQPVTGVQRFAAEALRALDRAWPDGWPPLRVLLPPGRLAEPPPLPAERCHPVGRRRGHAWEQMELPLHARGGLLVSLCNTAPMLLRNQLVVIHDVGVRAVPAAYSASFRAWYRTMHRVLAHRARRIATVSRFSRGELAHWLGLPPESVAVLPEGGDHMLRADADDGVLARHGLESGGYVLAVGSLAAHKNLAALTPAAHMLQARGCKLAIVGRAGARSFAGSGPVALPGATYLGAVSDHELRALYAHAACFAFPSLYEGFGLPPLEAMTCGCPVVAGTAEAVAEICGDAALYGRSADAIAAAIACVLDRPGLATGLRERGQKRAHDLTWDRAAAGLLAAVRPLVHPAVTECRT